MKKNAYYAVLIPDLFLPTPFYLLLTITFKSFRIFMIYKICLGELRVWLVFLCSALFFGHWMHIQLYLIIIPVWNGSRYNNSSCACIVEKFNVMLMSYECLYICKFNFLVHAVAKDNIFELISEGKRQ